MKKIIFILIFLIAVVGAAVWMITSKKSKPEFKSQTQTITFQELCSPKSSLFNSTGFLSENEAINLIGKYNSKTKELTNYDPYPCLEWQGEQQCRINYGENETRTTAEGKKFNILSMKTTACPDNVKKIFTVTGGYRVDKKCCVDNGDCKLIQGSYPSDEGCGVLVEASKIEKACFLAPIEINKTLEGVGENEYVYIQGRLSPFFRTQPADFKEQQKQHFIITIDSYKRIDPFIVGSKESFAVCKNYLAQNKNSIEKYCSDNNFLCDVDQSLESIEQAQTGRLVKFSTEQKWTVEIPVGRKDIIKQDRRLELNIICQIDPYSGNIDESTVCSQQGCILCGS